MSTNDSTHNRRFSLLPRLHGARLNEARETLCDNVLAQ